MGEDLDRGWFADKVSVEEGAPSAEHTWQPCLCIDAGFLTSLDIWFRTEAECLRFIYDNVIGQQVNPDWNRDD